MDEEQLKAARRAMSERTTIDGKPLSAADLVRMVEKEFDQSGLGDLLEKTSGLMPTDQQTIEQAIIGKRIVAMSWLPTPLFGSAFELKAITLEGGVKLSLRPAGFEGMIVVEIEETEHGDGRINARCVCPLCNQGHDPKLIGDSGEGKDEHHHEDGLGGGGYPLQ